jgi:hypothetical protein
MCSSTAIVRTIKTIILRWGEGYVAHMAVPYLKTHTIFYLKNLMGRVSCRRLKSRWKDGINMDLKEIVCEVLNFT